MKYLNEEIKAMLFSLIAKKTKLGWNFQGHIITESIDDRLMFTVQFSRKSTFKVSSEYCFMIDNLERAKELIQLWILHAKEPYEKTK
jgi:hypothetical protein|tara:strand:- start:433 stop:693 length:261 start_codon:yes stop_codon:yes gene_type:complete